MSNNVKKDKTLAKVFSPAKINLFFAITGRRADGYHSVFSANCAVNFGDNLQVCARDGVGDEILFRFDSLSGCNSCRRGGGGSGANEANGKDNILEQAAPGLDARDNTVARALDAFRAKTGLVKYFSVILEKNIPLEAGFGGGSSNAAAILRGVNCLHGNILPDEDLHEICRKIGADCPFFLSAAPSIARGIGEICEPLDEEMATALRNYNWLIFKPNFGVSTKVAYQTLGKDFSHLHIGEEEARRRFLCLRQAMLAGEQLLPLFNTFAAIFFLRHGRLFALCQRLQEMGANAMLSGSGSGFFCLAHRSLPMDAVEKVVKLELGDGGFVKNCGLLPQNLLVANG
ncbi:MAG: hypothetical protein LBI56_01430 [Puniceicoccales bacterium]|jgi:4-diphosphocytidyl-2-C-methyl-D-erythritol kinase|nr:hypothetical protein [Puniceicoccales bacterium]